MAPSLLDLLESLHRDAERVRREQEEARYREGGTRGLHKQSRGVPEPGLREHHVALDGADALTDPGLYA